jgi:hypothetical protein
MTIWLGGSALTESDSCDSKSGVFKTMILGISIIGVDIQGSYGEYEGKKEGKVDDVG